MRNSGSEIAGTPSSEHGTANEASPVNDSPTGAGPDADNVTQPSQSSASCA